VSWSPLLGRAPVLERHLARRSDGSIGTMPAMPSSPPKAASASNHAVPRPLMRIRTAWLVCRSPVCTGVSLVGQTRCHPGVSLRLTGRRSFAI
jgi:hypothetical protein